MALTSEKDTNNFTDQQLELGIKTIVSGIGCGD